MFDFKHEIDEHGDKVAVLDLGDFEYYVFFNWDDREVVSECYTSGIFAHDFGDGNRYDVCRWSPTQTLYFRQ